ncbi:MAG: hypothetical protein KZQ82_11260 [Candidatus Thiodiazotropha sp. (ex Lucinoma annulata)]|nr:hypothetical protein [Candidatus Thiodiazotropha sp. (ex Lucinoma borealis)]MCU7841357.1 hypothetical protein [Candidatus Thiodiazotropha sp. (ex Troendleina suluensis)]MCU7884762.1 hypothetical protein [Candidatus Thiodiazotropha sp. (ex Lucinoma annulata)]MCU7945691.1 hypothetical protein [Candidatus Thiodiazotropha sp. (ex Cardiolucina cf. quadrata)]MCU7865164.1 hypothetical protein [Candidatus Thiodiazotropha sp. (ex Lucinoma borealis)]
MKTGYLTLETHPEHKGLVRVLIKDELPSTQAVSPGSTVRYIVRFNDIEAGQMHLHNVLHNALIDLDNHIYRADLKKMIAAVEADDLHHKRVWIDPSLSDSEKEVIDAQTAKLKLRHKRWNTLWLIVGGFFIVLFFFMSTIGQI